MKKTELQLRNAFEQAAIGMVLVNPKGYFLQTNKAFQEITGYSDDELQQKTFNDITYPEDRQIGSSLVKKIISGEIGRCILEKRYIHNNGRIIYARLTTSLIHSNEDSPEYFFTQVEDITDLKQNEEENARLAQAVKMTNDSVAVVNSKGKVIDANNAMLRMLNFTKKSDVVGRFIIELVAPEDREKAAAQLQELLREDKNEITGEYVILTKDGKRVPVETTVNVMKIAFGKEIEFVAITRDITDRKRAEGAIKESEKNYRDLVEQSNDSIYVLLGDKYVLVNKSFTKMFGYTKKELLSKDFNLWNIVGSGSVEFIRKRIEMQESGKTVNKRYEFQGLTKDGHIIYLDVKSTHILWNGEPAIQGIYRDVTERKQAEDALRESEVKFRMLIEQSNDAIYLLFEDKFEIINSRFSELFGYTFKECQKINFSFQQLVSPKSLPVIEKRLEGKRKGKKLEPVYGFIAVTKDGNEIECEVSTSYIKYKGGTATQGIIRDITERKQTERKITEAADLLRSILESTDNGILVVNNEGKIVEANERFLKLWEVPKEFFNTLDDDVLFEFAVDKLSDPKQFIDKVKELYNKPDLNSFDTLYLKDGRIFDRYSQPLLVKGKSIGRVWSFLNVTEHKRAEEALRLSQDLLLQSHDQLRTLSSYLQDARERERTRMAREIHDDLGQALTAIRIDLANLKEELPTEQKIFKKNIKNIMNLADTTIKTVKRISTELRPSILDDLGLSSAIEWQAEEYHKRSNIAYVVEIKPKEILVEGQLSITIFRIFQELLTNIIKHAKADNIKIKLVKTKKDLELTINDDGIGITQIQINSKKSLGLIGVRERVNTINGSVSIIGNKSQGTTVNVNIPITDEGQH